MHFLAPKVTEVIKARPVIAAASTDTPEFKQDNSRTENLGSHSLSYSSNISLPLIIIHHAGSRRRTSSGVYLNVFRNL